MAIPVVLGYTYATRQAEPQVDHSRMKSLPVQPCMQEVMFAAAQGQHLNDASGKMMFKRYVECFRICQTYVLSAIIIVIIM